MFRNRSIKISLAKDKPGEGATTETSVIDVEQLAKVAQENAKSVAIGIGIAYAAKKVIDTTSQVILIAAESKFNH